MPFNKSIAKFIISASRIVTSKKYDYGNKFNREEMRKTKILLPTKNGKIDFDFIEQYMAVIEKERLQVIENYLKTRGLK